MLVELAARDDPPMVIDEPLRARLARAGIDLLEPLLGPVDGGVEVADTLDELEQVEALYFAGPGLSSRMPLGDQPTPVAVALERILAGAEPFVELRRFRLAAIDMRLVEQTALALLEPDGAARSFDRMLETALVVTYARCYLRGGLRVPGGWEPAAGPDRDLHCHVIHELRHPYHAHADRTKRRTLIDTTRYLGLDGPPTYDEAWHQLADSTLEALADLARR